MIKEAGEVFNVKKNKTMIAVFLTPAILMFVLVFLYPIFRTILMSFFKIEGITDSMTKWQFTGLANYSKLAGTSLFRISMWNLFRIWLIGGLIVMSLALLFAVIITSGIRFKSFFRAMIYLPNVVSAVALATMWLQYVYSPKFGLLKNVFSSIGLTYLSKVQWLDNDHKFMALLIAYCFGMVGYHMLIFASGIERIGEDYYEAATLDGANKINQFRYITFPLLKGVFKTNITMWSVTSVGFFVWSQLFSTVTADTQTITPMVYMYMMIFGAGNSMTERNAGLGASIGVLLSICVVAVFLICNKLIKDDDLEF
ncbi:binding-protein-dependent transport systems inner membrane component [[Clostridium] saccharolyticum WM1]|uniref:Binding-protein-dependent transport systems inner membrane component n=1 Tax=Lacrimispora saccharolytica (strain ATCC 35040 / DSM 2544 / NRCC 2533 / WM1) TaxID=610130 RepID=D9R1H1_LACSW|nr:binding-protein-dependent transport systems inner membrane component [[Clostridium] saccharolyticum WM1]